MYIRGLMSRNFAKLAEAVRIDKHEEVYSMQRLNYAVRVTVNIWNRAKTNVFTFAARGRFSSMINERLEQTIYCLLISGPYPSFCGSVNLSRNRLINIAKISMLSIQCNQSVKTN